MAVISVGTAACASVGPSTNASTAANANAHTALTLDETKPTAAPMALMIFPNIRFPLVWGSKVRTHQPRMSPFRCPSYNVVTRRRNGGGGSYNVVTVTPQVLRIHAMRPAARFHKPHGLLCLPRKYDVVGVAH